MMVGLSVVLLGRAHFVLYIKKQGSRTAKVVTWLATIIVAGFWVWKLVKIGLAQDA